jgi:opacity protein-like surface antigen
MNTNRSSYLIGAALGSALVLALSANAMAADIYDGGLKGGYDVPPPPPSDRGLYIKGYVGQANPDVGNIWTESFDTNNTFQIFHKDIKSSPLFGLGIGWRHSHWLRFDVTGEYRGDAVFLGQDSYLDPFASSGTGGATNEYTADVKSWLGLANAYIDMGNWCGFTPFVGAGIGFASINVSGLKDVNVPNNGVGYAADKTSTNFAWALYAGTSFDVTSQVALDLTYRYASLGDASSGTVTAYDGSGSISGVFIRDITSNDVMLGMRYKFQREPVAYVPVK